VLIGTGACYQGFVHCGQCVSVLLFVIAVVTRHVGTVMQQATSLCPSPAPAHPMWMQQTLWAGEATQAQCHCSTEAGAPTFA
jgi:hypothetical protein